MSKMTRFIEIDIAKGILIFLVILGHSPIEKWLACGIGSLIILYKKYILIYHFETYLEFLKVSSLTI